MTEDKRSGERTDGFWAEAGGETTPTVFMPEQAATVEAPDGRRIVLLHLPQAELIIKRLLASPAAGHTYRWGYHLGHRIHVLFVWWHEVAELGVAIPEGAGDHLLSFMTGTTDVLLTLTPLKEQVHERMSHQEMEHIISGFTVVLPDIQFQRKTI